MEPRLDESLLPADTGTKAGGRMSDWADAAWLNIDSFEAILSNHYSLSSSPGIFRLFRTGLPLILLSSWRRWFLLLWRFRSRHFFIWWSLNHYSRYHVFHPTIDLLRTLSCLSISHSYPLIIASLFMAIVYPSNPILAPFPFQFPLPNSSLFLSRFDDFIHRFARSIFHSS